MYVRKMRSVVENLTKKYPAVTLVGARGVGKTKLAKEIAYQNGLHFCNLEDLRQAVAARGNPIEFVQNLPKPIVIDGLHRVPELISPLKNDIEQNPSPGRYIFISSSDPKYDQRLQALNDCSCTTYLYPLSYGERLGLETEYFIDTLFAQKQLVPTAHGAYGLESLLSGGFAQTIDLIAQDRDAWFNKYVMHLIYQEVPLQMQPEDHFLLVRLLSVLATYAAGPYNVALLSRETGMPVTTIHRYLAVLKNLRIVIDQESCQKVVGIAKALKACQYFLHDVGLASWFIGADKVNAPEWQTSLLRHAICNEVLKQMTWNKTPITLSYMRTPTGQAVDMLLQRKDGKTVAICVKNGSDLTAQDTKGLLYSKEQLGERWHKGVILYTGAETMPLGNGIWVMPVSALWTSPSVLN